MLDSCIFNFQDSILPYKSKHDIPRLEFLSACKLMENENDIKKVIPYIPASIFKILFQSVIHQSYLEFIRIDDTSMQDLCICYNEADITFPETLGHLILNWPYEDLILRNLLTSLEPPIERFPSLYNFYILASQKQVICQIEEMLTSFHRFCSKLVQFITNVILKSTTRNTEEFSRNLRRLDVSGFRNLYSEERINSFARPDDIIEGIHNSTINTFGPKIEIFADAELDFEEKNDFELLRCIFRENLNPDFGISVYFKKITASFVPLKFIFSNEQNDTSLSAFLDVLALGRCEYIQLTWIEIDESFANQLCACLPKLVGINLNSARLVKSLDFLSAFEDLEQVSFGYNTYNGLADSIYNMSKGLKYLDLSLCTLKSKDFYSLANSIHSDTLLQLDLSNNKLNDDAVEFSILCEKLVNIKVLIINNCSLNALLPNLVSNLVHSFKGCDKLECLSMRENPFSLEITDMIIDGLAQNKSLRYLSLNLPESIIDGRRTHQFSPSPEAIEYLCNLCKIYHEKINICRSLPMYISWYLF